MFCENDNWKTGIQYTQKSITGIQVYTKIRDWYTGIHTQNHWYTGIHKNPIGASIFSKKTLPVLAGAIL